MDRYTLQVSDASVRAEADVTVCFVADFTYDDYDTASYDRESDTWFFLNTVEGEADDCVELQVGFVFELEDDGQIVVSDIEWLKETVVVKEEDRGDYDQYKCTSALKGGRFEEVWRHGLQRGRLSATVSGKRFFDRPSGGCSLVAAGVKVLSGLKGASMTRVPDRWGSRGAGHLCRDLGDR